MASIPFTKLLHTHNPHASYVSLVIQAEFNNTRCTYWVTTATTQLKYLEPDVFDTLSRLGLKFFLEIGPWGYFPSWSTGSSQDTISRLVMFASTPLRIFPLSSSSSTSSMFALPYICRWTEFPFTPRGPPVSPPTSSPPSTPSIPDVRIGI